MARIIKPSRQAAVKLTLARGLKKGEAKISLIMLSLPRKIGRKIQTREKIKRYVPIALNTAFSQSYHFP